MMKLKKQFAMLLISVLLIGILAACGTSEKEDNTAGNEDKKVLVMGTSADYPPFEYVETSKSDEIKGFDVDIAKAIGEKLGYEVQVKDIDFNSLVPSLENKTVDFVISGMTPTAKREESVDFSDIYYTAKNMIITTEGSKIKTTEDLKGKTVGVQLASIQETLATDLNKSKEIGMTIEKRNRIPEIIQEMLAKRFDAIIIEDTVAKGYLKDNTDLVGYLMESGEEDAGSAIAFQKDSKLTEAFNVELNKMLENGEMEKLILKWFGGSETE